MWVLDVHTEAKFLEEVQDCGQLCADLRVERHTFKTNRSYFTTVDFILKYSSPMYSIGTIGLCDVWQCVWVQADHMSLPAKCTVSTCTAIADRHVLG